MEPDRGSAGAGPPAAQHNAKVRTVDGAVTVAVGTRSRTTVRTPCAEQASKICTVHQAVKRDVCDAVTDLARGIGHIGTRHVRHRDVGADARATQVELGAVDARIAAGLAPLPEDWLELRR